VRTFTLVLKLRGYLTDAAGTGKEVTEKTKTNDYAAILIDDALPDMSGIELLSNLSHYKALKFMVTDEPAKALQCGANGCFIKPVHPEELLSMLSYLL
jgi:DNA-binding response OmpR family regulator